MSDIYTRSFPMKNVFPLFFLICSLSCTTPKPVNYDYQESYMIIGYQEKYNIFKNSKPTELNEQEISNLNRILEDALSQYNLSKTSKFDLNDYKRQYVPVINDLGEKEVWINCLCNQNNENWKNGIILVEDGGSCYFNLKINLSKSKYYDLIINGDA